MWATGPLQCCYILEVPHLSCDRDDFAHPREVGVVAARFAPQPDTCLIYIALLPLAGTISSSSKTFEFLTGAGWLGRVNGRSAISIVCPFFWLSPLAEHAIARHTPARNSVARPLRRPPRTRAARSVRTRPHTRAARSVRTRPHTRRSLRSNAASHTRRSLRLNAASHTRRSLRLNAVSHTRRSLRLNAASHTRRSLRLNAASHTRRSLRSNAASHTRRSPPAPAATNTYHSPPSPHSRSVHRVTTVGRKAGLGRGLTAVLGTQWGDEGKGKLVDVLAQQ